MSSKPGAGINHKEFGVTSEGVAVFVERALTRPTRGGTRSRVFGEARTATSRATSGGCERLAVGARRRAWLCSGTRDPEGRVPCRNRTEARPESPRRSPRSCNATGRRRASSAWRTAAAYARNDPTRDFDVSSELRRLVEASAPIASFDNKLLGNRGALRTADDGDGAALRDAMHFRVDADVLVPCGGRPGTIHAGNAREFLKPGDDGAPGAPRAPIIVEGANLFLTPEARQILHGEAGVLVVKDSSANKCGVVCSSYEIWQRTYCPGARSRRRRRFIVAEVEEVLERLRALASLRSRPAHWLISASTADSRARCPTSRAASRRQSTSWPTLSSRRRATTRSPRYSRG